MIQCDATSAGSSLRRGYKSQLLVRSSQFTLFMNEKRKYLRRHSSPVRLNSDVGKSLSISISMTLKMLCLRSYKLYDASAQINCLK